LGAQRGDLGQRAARLEQFGHATRLHGHGTTCSAAQGVEPRVLELGPTAERCFVAVASAVAAGSTVELAVELASADAVFVAAALHAAVSVVLESLLARPAGIAPCRPLFIVEVFV